MPPVDFAGWMWSMPRMRKSLTLWVILVAVLAFVAKICIAAQTLGTWDVQGYFYYGKLVSKFGLGRAYQLDIFNLPPLLGWFGAWLYGFSDADLSLFGLTLKLPGILSHLALTLGILWLASLDRSISAGSVLLFALSPISLMIDGFHGNFDSVVALLMFLSVGCAMQKRLFLAALFLAAGAQVKIVALLITPIIAAGFFERGNWRNSLLFCAHVAWLTLLGWLPGFILAPKEFLAHVLNYASNFGVWGVTYFLGKTGLPEFQALNSNHWSKAQQIVAAALKLGIIGSVLWIAWRQRLSKPGTLFSSVAKAWGIFFALTPGFGTQYLIWIGPFLAIASFRWFAAYILSASVALFVYYDSGTGGLPWRTTLLQPPPATSVFYGMETIVLLLPWAVFLAYALWTYRELLRGKQELASTADSAQGECSPLSC